MHLFASSGIDGFGIQNLEVSRIHTTKAVQESHSQFTKPFHNCKLSKLVCLCLGSEFDYYSGDDKSSTTVFNSPLKQGK